MGEIIASSRAIPRTDLFSFTAAGQTFVVQNWLGEILYWFTYRLGGFPLLVCVNTLLLAAALLPILLLCREATSNTRIAVLASFVSSFVFFGNMRPQVFSFVLFALFYWVLMGYKRGVRDGLWVLPALMVLWVNLHGAFVLGLGLMLLFLAAETWRRITNPAGEVLSWGRLRKLGLVFVTCFAATLVNPEFHRLYDYVRVVMSDPSSQQFVAEWQPPSIKSVQGVLSFYALFLLSIPLMMYARRRPDLTELCLFVGFGIFGLTASRNTIWFGIVMPPILAGQMAAMDFHAISAFSRRFGFRGNGIGSPRPGQAAARLNSVIAAGALGVVVLVSPWVHPALYSVSLLERQTPVGAMDYIEKNSIRGNIFHPQIFGDYLIWRLYPRQRSFFDGRVHLFGEDFVRDYRMLPYDKGWEERLRKYDIRYLLLSKDPGQEDSAELIRKAGHSDRWTQLFDDDVSVLFALQPEAAAVSAPAKPPM
jgi:hypothetical protein